MKLTPPDSGSHIPIANGHKVHSRFDLAASFLSLGCALHCMLLPMLLAFLPGSMIALRSFQHPWHGAMTWLLRLSRWEWALALTATSLCLLSISWGWRTHRRNPPVILALAGGGMLLLASLHPQVREAVALHGGLAAAGGACLAAAHLGNRRALGVMSH